MPEAANYRLKIPCVFVFFCYEELRLNTGSVLMRTAFSHLEVQDFDLLTTGYAKAARIMPQDRLPCHPIAHLLRP